MNLDNARLHSARLRGNSLSTASPDIVARRQLEQAWKAAPRLSWQENFKALGLKLLASLTRDQAPRITPVTTAAGMRWRVYDPVGDRTHIFTQESEVRAWLEQRYYLP